MSDFELVDLKSEKKEKASWYQYIEQSVHDLFDNNRIEPVYYTKRKEYNQSCNCYLDRYIKKYQECVISIEDSIQGDVNIPNIMLYIEDGSKYLVKRVSINNKIFDEKTETPDDQCIICYEYIIASKLRHPLIEAIQTDIPYVSNDIEIGTENQKGIILYGLNSKRHSKYHVGFL